MIQSIVYFEGDLAVSREKNETLNKIASAYYQDHLGKLCQLTQRKLGMSNYSYIATYRDGCRPSKATKEFVEV